MARKYWTQTFLMMACSVSLAMAAVDDTAVKVKWGYSGRTGPAEWGKLNKDFALCSTGKLQSPINVTGQSNKDKNNLIIHYQSAPMTIVDDGTTSLMIGKEQTLINDGHGIQLNFPKDQAQQFITVHGKKFRLVQFHIHTPGENTLNNRSFPLEIHFVHQGENGKLAVIGVFAKEGKENTTIRKVIANLPRVEGQPQVVAGEQINPGDLLPVSQTYYSFAGSLTTPPCAEGVAWFVMAEPITMSGVQIKKLRNAAGASNARPVQALNGREIAYSDK